MQVIPGSPAARAGVWNDDVIVEFDGMPVTNINQVCILRGAVWRGSCSNSNKAHRLRAAWRREDAIVMILDQGKKISARRVYTVVIKLPKLNMNPFQIVDFEIQLLEMLTLLTGIWLLGVVDQQIVEALGDKVGMSFKVVVKRAHGVDATLYVVAEEATPDLWHY